MGPSLSTVSRPVARSTSTFLTPGTSLTSSLTELTQWPQVMPFTVNVAVLIAISPPACRVWTRRPGRGAGRRRTNYTPLWYSHYPQGVCETHQKGHGRAGRRAAAFSVTQRRRLGLGEEPMWKFH